MVAVRRCPGGDRLRRHRATTAVATLRLRAVGPDLLGERELWRVEAAAGMAPVDDDGDHGGGVFDLSFDWSDGTWQLVGCVD